MRLIDAEPIIKNLSEMKTQLGYDAISIDGMVKALREAERVDAAQPPNDPLTLEELRKMDGEPVWVETTDVKKANRWTFVDVGCEVVRFFDTRCGVKCSVMGNHFRAYGKTWLAYRRKPEKCVSAPADPAVPGWAEHLNARFLRTE